MGLTLTEHLNGGILDDRSLLADGRNETETQTLRDWTTAWSPAASYRDRNGSSSSSHTYSSSTASQYSSPSTYSGSDIEVSRLAPARVYSRLTWRSGITKHSKLLRVLPRFRRPTAHFSIISRNHRYLRVPLVLSTPRRYHITRSQPRRPALYMLLTLWLPPSYTCRPIKPIHTQCRT